MEAPQSASDTEESVSSSTEDNTAHPSLAVPPIFRSLSNVFENVVPQKSTGLGSQEWPNLLEHADSGLETDKALQAVVSILQYLEHNSPATLVSATRVLADGSRYGKILMNIQAVTTTTTRTPQ